MSDLCFMKVQLYFDNICQKKYGQKREKSKYMICKWYDEDTHYIISNQWIWCVLGDPHQDVECNCQFRCVVKQQLNDLTLMYSICAHAIDQTRHQENFTDMRSFVSLRAVKEFNEPFKKRNYKRYSNYEPLSHSSL